MDLILKYFPDITPEQKAQFSALKELYEYWNSKINVISRKDIDLLYERHVLHSLAIGKVIQFASKSDVLDVGTGGGFPGLPLAILFPEVNFHLIDSIGKKLNVVNEVSSSLGLKNIRTSHIRAEEIKDKYDFIISRAVTAFPDFHKWVRNKIKKTNNNTLANGILYLKGGDLSDELTNFPSVKLYEISKWFDEEFFETKKIVYLQL